MAKVKVKKINQEEMLEHIRAIKSAKQAIKDLEEQIKGDQNAIVTVMNDHGIDEMNIDVFKVSYKEVVTRRLKTEDIKKDLPDLYKKYSYDSSCMKFLIT